MRDLHRRLCQQPRRHALLLLQQVRDTYNVQSEERTSSVLERAQTVPLLVLDGGGDTGRASLSPHDEAILLEVLNERSNANRVMIVTTNMNGSDLLEHVGERAVSRLMGMCGTRAQNGNVVCWLGPEDIRMAGWEE